MVRLCRYTVAQETDYGPIKKMSTLVNFQELPVIGTDPPERADAARNRRRILAAAEKLFAENGVSCTSMDAIAAEAGVGKGTLFRRFGDRASLAWSRSARGCSTCSRPMATCCSWPRAAT